MHFQLIKCKFCYTRGCCLGPPARPLPLDSTRGLKAGLEPTRGFSRFALDVSPSSKFLKVDCSAIAELIGLVLHTINNWFGYCIEAIFYV